MAILSKNDKDAPAPAPLPAPKPQPALQPKPSAALQQRPLRATASSGGGFAFGGFCLLLGTLALLGTIGLQFFAMKAMFAL